MSGLLAIDVGSSRVKLGLFASPGEWDDRQLPQPQATLAVLHRGVDRKQWSAELKQWLEQPSLASSPACCLASVHPKAAKEVAAVLAENEISEVHVLSQDEVPIAVEVKNPQQVGIDRLLNALAANRLRKANQPAIVVDVGSASTVDLVGPDGAFQGGAILPGIGMSAAALHAGTASLPLLSAEILADQPAVIGKTTQEAIAAGVYWGAVGAIGELIDRLGLACAVPPMVLLTGEDAKRIVVELQRENRRVQHVPNMVLSGVCIAREKRP